MEEENSDNSIDNSKKINLLSRTFIIAYIIIFILLIGGASLFFYFSTQKRSVETGIGNDGNLAQENLFKDFSDLIINSAHAKDNFSLTALRADLAGVDSDSSYRLKSKEPLPLEMIKKNIKVTPPVPYQVKEVSDTEWELKPENDFEPNEIVKIAINAGYEDEEGKPDSYEYSWAFQVKDSFKVVHSIPREAGVSVPVNTGIEIVFSHEGFYDYEKYFKIEPAVPGKFEVHSRTLVFVPYNTLAPGKIYTVSVFKGLPLKDSEQKLATDYVFSFETRRDTHSSSWISIGDRSVEVDPGTAPIIKVYSYNAPRKFTVDLYKFNSFGDFQSALEERDKIPFWSYSKEAYLLSKDNVFKLMSFEAELKTEGRNEFIVFPKELEKGFYLAEIYNENNQEKNIVQVLIQSSDLAVYSNFTNTESLVWVNSISKGGPATGARVSVLNTGVSSRTDAQGLALFTTPEALKKTSGIQEKTESNYLKVEKEDDVILSPASKIFRSYWWSPPALADNYWNYLYTDRPRYQSNDVIKFWGILKDREEKRISQKISVSLYKQGYVDYYYQPVKISEQEVNLSELGSFSGELLLDNVKPDYYTLELTLDGEVIKTKYITVRPYVKPAYSLSLEPSKTKTFAGDEVELKVKSAFFEGTPVPNLDLVITTPKGKFDVISDENGEASIKYKKDYFDCTREYGCWPDAEYFYVEPKNSELAEIKESAVVTYYGPEVYIETKTEYPEAGQAELKIVSRKYDLEKSVPDNWWQRDNDDEIAPFTKVKIKISEIRYEKIETGTQYDYINKRSYKTYRYDKKVNMLDAIEVETDANGEYVLSQAVVPETYYEISLIVSDSKDRVENSRTGLYYYNGISTVEYTNWRYNYYHLRVQNEGRNFSLGERVETIFMNGEEALPERSGSYLYLQLRNGLKKYDIADNSNYNFNFEQSHIPNINLSAVYFNGRTYLKTSTGYYGESIKYDIDDSRLKIMVEPDKEKYLPGGEVNLNVYVTDKNDRPLVAEVNLNLIDEAYYAVISDSASPLETLYSNIGPGILLSESTHESLKDQAAMAEKGGCFLAGTKILMADNTRKNIEEIKEGDKILTFSDPFDRQIVTGEVRELWQGLRDEYLIINEDFKLTPEHQVYSNYHFIDAGLLRVGDWLLDAKGERVQIKNIEIVFAPVMVYNLRIEPQHTFFANDFYVHNQEKGGGVREFFSDAALFDVVKTGANGRASVSFTLPDNITSWRITSQAISENMDAGVSVSKIPVSLPVFTEVSLGSEYLSQDKPTVRLRAFGTRLNEGDDVIFSISSESLGLNVPALPAKAFAPVYYDLGTLRRGEHDIVYGLEAKDLADNIKLPLRVIGSRLEMQKAIDEELGINTKITPPTADPFVLAFLDKGQNMLFDPLLRTAWTWGDRIDQKIAGKEAIRALNKYYSAGYDLPDFSAENYQLDSGGLSLLPYSGEDLEISLKAINLNAEYFDETALGQYFFKILENRNSNREEITYSLCGLVALGEPLIPRLKSWLLRDDLSLKEKIYLSIALTKTGLKEEAREHYYEMLSAYGEQKDPYIVVKDSEENDRAFETTALMAYLGAILQDENAMPMFDFVNKVQKLSGREKNSEQLFVLEKMAYLKNELPNLNPAPARIVFEFLGEEREVDISGGKIYAFEVRPENAGSIIFKQVEGEIAVSKRYMTEMTQAVQTNDKINIKRTYFVNNKKTAVFSEDDLIEVRIYPEFSASAYDGDYQITDILPSGLAPVTKLYARGRNYDCKYWYPYNIDGQKVKFRINKNWKNSYCGGDYFRYYARVVSKGTFLAEPALLQSFDNPEYLNFSGQEEINIK